MLEIGNSLKYHKRLNEHQNPQHLRQQNIYNLHLSLGKFLLFLIDNFLFCGDVLFRGSIGRTDFPDSNHNDMIKSLDKLKNLPDNTIVYSGHGPATTIGFEKQNNYYLI